MAAGVDPYLNRLAVSYAALGNVANANSPGIYRTNSSYQRFSPYWRNRHRDIHDMCNNTWKPRQAMHFCPFLWSLWCVNVLGFILLFSLSLSPTHIFCISSLYKRSNSIKAMKKTGSSSVVFDVASPSSPHWIWHFKGCNMALASSSFHSIFYYFRRPYLMYYSRSKYMASDLSLLVPFCVGEVLDVGVRWKWASAVDSGWDRVR